MYAIRSYYALPLIEIIPNAQYEFFDYEAKYQPGASKEICPAEVDDQVREQRNNFV